MSGVNGGALQALRQATGRAVPDGMEMAVAQDVGGGANIAAVAAAEQARARIQARTLMAYHNPRDMDDVRVRLLKECRRLSFARAAVYTKPVGGGETVSGPSIRFAEAALRIYGNVDIEAVTAYEDDNRRVVRVSVVDLETNASYSLDVPIEKTVERSSAGKDREVVGRRMNSKGREVFVVRATEDELLVKQAALVSKAIRTNGLRLIPGDIVDECSDLIAETLRKEDASDPDAARKSVADAFASIGVPPAALKSYLGHTIEASSPAELQRLRGIYQAIRDGETTWAAVVEAVRGESADGPAAPNGNADPARQTGDAPTNRTEPTAESEATAIGRGDRLTIPQKQRLWCLLAGQTACPHGKDELRTALPEAARNFSLDEFRDLVAQATEAP